VRAGDKEFVLADIPGLIEGAHEGHGLGTRFLGHVERTRVLLHLVDGTQEDVQLAYRTIRKELRLYGGGLAEKPEIVALNKVDALTSEEIEEKRTKLRRSAKKPVVVLSGAAGIGVEDVMFALWRHIDAARDAELEPARDAARLARYSPIEE
jgi:GTP-binding protein